MDQLVYAVKVDFGSVNTINKVCYTLLSMSSVDGEVAIDATTDTTVVEPKKKKVVIKEE